jgi:hypothetical protein
MLRRSFLAMLLCVCPAVLLADDTRDRVVSFLIDPNDLPPIGQVDTIDAQCQLWIEDQGSFEQIPIAVQAVQLGSTNGTPFFGYRKFTVTFTDVTIHDYERWFAVMPSINWQGVYDDLEDPCLVQHDQSTTPTQPYNDGDVTDVLVLWQWDYGY